MPTWNKFNSFVQYLAQKQLALDGSPPPDTLKIMLTNTLPLATNRHSSDILEIAAGNGYTTGGAALVNPSGALSGGTETLASDEVVVSASGGSIAAFRYAVLYDATTGILIAWSDYGSSITVPNSGTFTILFNGVSPQGTVYTLS